MEIVIKIPQEKYNMIKNKMYCGIYDAEVYESIANGTPLPKGHGRLIDADKLEPRDISPELRCKDEKKG